MNPKDIERLYDEWCEYALPIYDVFSLLIKAFQTEKGLTDEQWEEIYSHSIKEPSEAITTPINRA